MRIQIPINPNSLQLDWIWHEKIKSNPIKSNNFQYIILRKFFALSMYFFQTFFCFWLSNCWNTSFKTGCNKVNRSLYEGAMIEIPWLSYTHYNTNAIFTNAIKTNSQDIIVCLCMCVCVLSVLRAFKES